MIPQSCCDIYRLSLFSGNQSVFVCPCGTRRKVNFVCAFFFFSLLFNPMNVWLIASMSERDEPTLKSPSPANGMGPERRVIDMLRCRLAVALTCLIECLLFECRTDAWGSLEEVGVAVEGEELLSIIQHGRPCSKTDCVAVRSVRENVSTRTSIEGRLATRPSKEEKKEGKRNVWNAKHGLWSRKKKTSGNDGERGEIFGNHFGPAGWTELEARVERRSQRR